MARLVLVHGAFAGAWWWECMVEPLEQRGHTAEVFDLPGSGEDGTPVANVSLDAYVERITAQLDEHPDRAVLVPHSMGGIAATQTAALHPDKVEAIVYVCSFAPRDGQSLLALTQLPEGADDEIQANMVVEGDPPTSRMPPEASLGAQYEYCTPEDARWAIARQRPQPVAPFEQPVRIPEGVFAQIPRAYVLSTRDRSIPPALQRRMVAENGITDMVELEADHTPQLSCHEELVEAIDKLVSDVLERRRELSA
jgi:pimeloyl-ACP methyl ester carboxylesterase